MEPAGQSRFGRSWPEPSDQSHRPGLCGCTGKRLLKTTGHHEGGAAGMEQKQDQDWVCGARSGAGSGCDRVVHQSLNRRLQTPCRSRLATGGSHLPCGWRLFSPPGLAEATEGGSDPFFSKVPLSPGGTGRHVPPAISSASIPRLGPWRGRADPAAASPGRAPDLLSPGRRPLA
jgi:hypothetical protein